MKQKVVIIGASRYAKVIADIILKSDDKIVEFLDDNPELKGEFIGFPMLGKVQKASKYKEYKYVVAIGNANIREKIANELQVDWYIAIHPTAVISSIDVEIGESSVVMANAVINSGAKIGRHCIVNAGAIIEHDNIIEDFVDISVGASLAGNITIERKSWIGIGSQIIQGKTFCEETMLGVGATVIKDIKEKGTYAGVPERKINMKNRTNIRGRVDRRTTTDVMIKSNLLATKIIEWEVA